jgi:hypothetical protein
MAVLQSNWKWSLHKLQQFCLAGSEHGGRRSLKSRCDLVERQKGALTWWKAARKRWSSQHACGPPAVMHHGSLAGERWPRSIFHHALRPLQVARCARRRVLLGLRQDRLCPRHARRVGRAVERVAASRGFVRRNAAHVKRVRSLGIRSDMSRRCLRRTRQALTTCHCAGGCGDSQTAPLPAGKPSSHCCAVGRLACDWSAARLPPSAWSSSNHLRHEWHWRGSPWWVKTPGRLVILQGK